MQKFFIMTIGFLMAYSAQNSAYAAVTEFYVIGFGKDGATNQSNPTPDSIKSASAVFNQTGNINFVEEHIELDIESSGFSLVFDDSAGTLDKVINSSSSRSSSFNVFISGYAAKILFQVLKPSSDNVVVGNIHCQKTPGQYSCSIQETAYRSIRP